jgi:hypothetical protein
MHQSKNPKTPSGEELDKPQVETVAADMVPEQEAKELRPGQRIPIRWEYHRLIVRDTAARIPVEDLNALGRQGWELVTVFHLHADINFIFKRMDLP